MADTIFTTSNALTSKLFSQELMVEAKKRTVFTKFIGKDSGAMIQTLEELQKHPGDKVTFGLRMQLTGSGVAGDSVLEGQEEALSFFSTSLSIDQLRHAVKVTGNMSQQRVAYNLRSQAMSGLADWFSSRYDVAIINHLTGNSSQTNLLFTGNNTPVAPSSANQIFAGNVGGESSLTASNTFSLPMINQMVVKAKTLTPAIRPIKLKYGEYYLLFLHPLQLNALKNDTNATGWNGIYQAMIMGQTKENNPIFTGAAGMYNGVIIHEDARVTYGDNTQNLIHTDLGAPASGTTSVARAVFCGAQAAVMSWGRGYDWPHRYKWVEQTKDYENQLGVSCGAVFGATKCVYNSLDFATIVASTWAA